MALFPFYEQDNLRKNLIDNVVDPQYVNCNGINSVGAQVVKILVCPSDSAMPTPAVGQYKTYYFGLSSYGGCSGTSATTITGSQSLQNGVFYMNSSIRITDITDGASNTLLFGERSRRNLTFTSTAESTGGWAWANYYAQEDNTMNASEPMEGLATHDLNQFGSHTQAAKRSISPSRTVRSSRCRRTSTSTPSSNWRRERWAGDRRQPV